MLASLFLKSLQWADVSNLGFFSTLAKPKRSGKQNSWINLRNTLHKKLKCVLENQGNTENQQCAQLRPNQTLEENSGANSWVNHLAPYTAFLAHIVTKASRNWTKHHQNFLMVEIHQQLTTTVYDKTDEVSLAFLFLCSWRCVIIYVFRLVTMDKLFGKAPTVKGGNRTLRKS